MIDDGDAFVETKDYNCGCANSLALFGLVTNKFKHQMSRLKIKPLEIVFCPRYNYQAAVWSALCVVILCDVLFLDRSQSQPLKCSFPRYNCRS